MYYYYVDLGFSTQPLLISENSMFVLHVVLMWEFHVYTIRYLEVVC